MNRKELVARTSDAMSQLFPEIIRGVQLEFIGKENITNSQFIVLMAVFSERNPSMGRLASMLGVSMPTVTGIVGRLVARRLIERIADADDRRKIFVSLTRKGVGVVETFKGIARHRWTEMLKVLENEEIEKFYQVVRSMSSKIGSRKG